MRIRLATKNDVNSIMNFIDLYWKKDHILARNQELFEWMYVKEDECFFTIAEEEETGELYGIHGYIPYGYQKPFDAGSSIWKVRKSDVPLLGLEITKYEKEHAGYCEYIIIGMNKRSAKICELMGGMIANLSHYYILGDFDEYRIAKVVNKVQIEVTDSKARLVPLLQSEDCEKVILNQQKGFAHKTAEYLKHRYYDHPVYEYQCWGIMKNENYIESMFFGREVEHAGRKIFKIVDFVGDKRDFALIGVSLRRLIQLHQYEYIDLYSYGIESEILFAAGFVYRDEEDPNIIPNYFEPFEQKNVEIRLVVPDSPGILVFRGDGDMDRPSK